MDPIQPITPRIPNIPAVERVSDRTGVFLGVAYEHEQGFGLIPGLALRIR